MFKKIKSFFLLSLATIMMLSCTTVAFAQSDLMPGYNNKYGNESYMYFPDSLYVKAGSKVVLKSTLTTNGSFYQKGLKLSGFTVGLDTDKIPSARFNLEVFAKSKKNETFSRTIKFDTPVDSAAINTLPNFYDDSYVTITLVARDDLYVSNYWFISNLN
ncbi:hypothetical protein [Lacrimispora sp.]|jgi:hypothetical protein|uniref:hypothetical protein n=1 Tax=Lacrimispora sp. TaxID=2719234 RepID=UPI00289BA759|nr:hypothetical protein [Lacrimispora sp.]